MKIVGTIKKIFENPRRDGKGVWHNIILDDDQRVSCWKNEWFVNVQEGDIVEIPIEQSQNTDSKGNKYLNVCGQVMLYNAKLDENNNPDDEPFDPKDLEDGEDEEDRERFKAEEEAEERAGKIFREKEGRIEELRKTELQTKQLDIRRAVALKAVCNYAGKDDHPYTIEDVVEMCKRAMIFLDTGE